MWLYMAVYSCIWLYADVYGCIWLYIAIYGCIWLHVAVHGCIWVYMVVNLAVWVYLAVSGCIYGSIWLYLVVYGRYGCIMLYIAACGCIWMYVADIVIYIPLYGDILLFMVVLWRLLWLLRNTTTQSTFEKQYSATKETYTIQRMTNTPLGGFQGSKTL